MLSFNIPKNKVRIVAKYIKQLEKRKQPTKKMPSKKIKLKLTSSNSKNPIGKKNHQINITKTTTNDPQ